MKIVPDPQIPVEELTMREPRVRAFPRAPGPDFWWLSHHLRDAIRIPGMMDIDDILYGAIKELVDGDEDGQLLH